jgi:exopolysaccharide/PEP-CTERM locus tyrosine autokinase
MSIVERALQKAQAAKPQAEVPTGAEPETADAAAPPTAPEPSPAAASQAPRTSLALGGMVAVNIAELRAQGRLPAEGMAHRTEEEFRRIKWPLLNAISGLGGSTAAANNLILVTSAVPGEGKTFTALNLALSLAREPDIEVLLVDGDVAQPTLSASLGITSRPGLTDVVADPSLDFASIICPTSIDRLFVAPAGARRDNSPELLASARMAALMEDLALRVAPGVVVFDSPPVLATNEAQVLSRYVGQIVMVVRADVTEQRVVTEALGLLDRTKPVSAVLNKVESSLISRYYSYYYYGYGNDGKGQGVKT